MFCRSTNAIQSNPVLCPRQGLLLARRICHFLDATTACYPAETDTCTSIGQSPDDVRDITNKRILSTFAHNRHVLITVQSQIQSNPVQSQSDGCSLSSKDGAVVRESFGQVAASCLTILEMAADDHCCPTLSRLSWIRRVDFVMWSLPVTILIEFGLGFMSGCNILYLSGAFSYDLHERLGVFNVADQIGVELHSVHSYL